MDLETLYPLVTEAIRRAEVFEDLHAPGARDAWRDVSRLEERITRILPASDPEGAIARRGAVRAAIAGGECERACDLVTRFKAEDDVSVTLVAELEALRQRATVMSRQQTAVLRSRYPGAFARHGEVAIQQFVLAYHQQGAPLPIR